MKGDPPRGDGKSLAVSAYIAIIADIAGIEAIEAIKAIMAIPAIETIEAIFYSPRNSFSHCAMIGAGRKEAARCRAARPFSRRRAGLSMRAEMQAAMSLSAAVVAVAERSSSGMLKGRR